MSLSEVFDNGVPHTWANLRVNNFTVDNILTANTFNVNNLTTNSLTFNGVNQSTLSNYEEINIPVTFTGAINPTTVMINLTRIGRIVTLTIPIFVNGGSNSPGTIDSPDGAIPLRFIPTSSLSPNQIVRIQEPVGGTFSIGFITVVTLGINAGRIRLYGSTNLQAFGQGTQSCGMLLGCNMSWNIV